MQISAEGILEDSNSISEERQAFYDLKVQNFLNPIEVDPLIFMADQVKDLNNSETLQKVKGRIEEVLGLDEYELEDVEALVDSSRLKLLEYYKTHFLK